MSDILKMASVDSPAAVWIIFLFILVFMGFLFYVALMDKNHAQDMAGKALDDSDLLLDHEIDGIRELDNDLPPWWLKLFYASIAFAAIYLLGYHVVELWNLPDAEYVQAMTDAGKGPDSIKKDVSGSGEDGSEPIVLSEEEKKALALKAGKKAYMNCISCHAADGGGGLGPNLTDKHWIHGGDKASIVKVIKEGVPGTAMISWQAVLRDDTTVEALADYILSFQGTTPAAPIPPQGEIFNP